MPITCTPVKLRMAFVLLAAGMAIRPQATVAQVDTRSARDARAAIQLLRRSYAAQPAWQELTRQVPLDELDFELRAGDRAQRASLEQAAAQLRGGLAKRFPAGALDRLTTALDARAAELAPIDRQQWAAECHRQAEQFAAVTPEELRESKQLLGRRLDEFARLWPALTKADNEWGTFLLWTETGWLKTADTMDAATLDTIEAHWRGAAHVWAPPELVDASLAVQSYAQLLRRHLAAETAEAHAAAWNQLAAALDAPESSSGVDTTHIAALVVGRERLGQSCAVTTSIRRELSQANLLLRARTAWLQAVLGGKSNERYQVNDVYAGARTLGNGTISADTQLQVLPSSAVGRWVFKLDGVANAVARGSSEGVRVASRATTRIHGEKQFAVSARGISAAPAKVEASTSIVYTSVDAEGRGRRRSEAIQQTHARRGQAESEAAAATRRSIAQRMDAEGRNLADEFNRSAYARMRNQQIDSGRASAEPRIRTEGDAVWFECWLEDPERFAAPAPPPLFQPQADLVVSLATSALEERSHDVFGGRQLAGTELSAEIGRLTGQEGQASSRALDFQVAFADTPCEFQFAEGTVRLRFYVTSFESAEVHYPSMTVDATYQVEAHEEKLVLVRQGGVRVHPRAGIEGQAQMSGRQQTLRVAVERKLNKALPNEIIWQAPAVPFAGKDAPKMRILGAESHAGWLQVALTRP